MFLTQAKQATKVTKTTKAKKRQQWQGNKTPSGDRMEEKKKNLGGSRLSLHSPLANKRMNEQCMIMFQGALQVRSQIGLSYLKST